jgi:hypothetical protein
VNLYNAAGVDPKVLQAILSRLFSTELDLVIPELLLALSFAFYHWLPSHSLQDSWTSNEVLQWRLDSYRKLYFEVGISQSNKTPFPILYAQRLLHAISVKARCWEAVPRLSSKLVTLLFLRN